MKKTPGKFWLRRDRGATLVEAVAAIGLMGTLLVSVLLLRGNLTVQSGRAEIRLKACELLDRVIGEWWPDRIALPREDSGEVMEHEGWRWRRKKVRNDDAEALHTEVVAVEVFAPGGNSEVPLARAEILLPREDDDEEWSDFN